MSANATEIPATKDAPHKTVLITGGAGFFGGILTRYLLGKGYACVVVDLVADNRRDERLISVQGDIRDVRLMEALFREHQFACVFHIAAILAHDKAKRSMLWASNVEATRQLVDLCKKYQVPSLVYTSSNCLWAKNFGRPVTEDDTPEPVEPYGRSKQEAERIILEGAAAFPMKAVIIRCPTIIDAGRLGLLTILFDFIRENKKVWVVGDGGNRYQFIFAPDLADACEKAMDYPQTDIFNIGSDHVTALRDVYAHVIERAGSKSQVASLPRRPLLALMRLCHWFGLSPLGPYHYKMIAEDFIFDTGKIKSRLHWQPTVTNEDMMYRAYCYYVDDYLRQDCYRKENRSAHNSTAKMGVIRLLKWLSW